jgi:hypothetical protein
MEPTIFLYGAPGRGFDPQRHGGYDPQRHGGYAPQRRDGYDPSRQAQPVYYQPVQPVYYPYPYYYGPTVNPYEAARQGESADRIASLIWKLVLVVVVCVVVGVIALVAMIG